MFTQIYENINWSMKNKNGFPITISLILINKVYIISFSNFPISLRPSPLAISLFMAFVCRRRAFRCIFARFISPRSQIPVPQSQIPVPASQIPVPASRTFNRSRRMPLQSLTRLPEERASVKRRLRPAGNDGASRRIPSPISHFPSPISHLPS